MYSQVKLNNKPMLKAIDKWEKGAIVEECNKAVFTKMGEYYTITNSNELKGYAYIGRVNSCRSGGCAINGDESEEGFEYFDYFVITDPKGTVVNLGVCNYQASYGEEITAKSWLKQFVGFDGSKRLAVGKGIDGISGATSSVNAITENIQVVVEEIKSIR